MSALDLIRPDLASMKSYIPGSDQLDGRLHMNELPWSPIDLPIARLNHYPAIEPQQQLQRQLSARYQVQPEALLLTRGSDEGIDLLMRLFLRSGMDSMMQCPPTFSMYAFYAHLQQAMVINCPLAEAEGFSLNLELMREKWQLNCKLIMLCRPNNPTGNLIHLKTISELCQHYQDRSIIVVDEAYIEFSDEISATSLINQFDNLIVLRTLSKACGLAGLRVGAIIAQPAIIKALETIVAPFTFSSAVLDLSVRALQNTAWFEEAIQRIKVSRAAMMADLQRSRWIEKVYPSAANFILVKTHDAKALFEYFSRQSIAVRQFATTPSLQQHLRITVGDEVQNKSVLAALVSFTGDM